jgi:hypothetical protein
MVIELLAAFALFVTYIVMRPFFRMPFSNNPNIDWIVYPVRSYFQKFKEDFTKFGDSVAHLKEVNWLSMKDNFS